MANRRGTEKKKGYTVYFRNLPERVEFKTEFEVHLKTINSLYRI